MVGGAKRPSRRGDGQALILVALALPVFFAFVALVVDGSSDVNGIIWIENGDLNYVGNSGTTGFYAAQNVTIDGNSYTTIGLDE